MFAPKVTDTITGISFLPPEPSSGLMAAINVLESIAACSVNHLQQGGYMADTEIHGLLQGYHSHLTSGGSLPACRDFLAYTALHQARKHAVTPEGEVSRMQRVLRQRLHDEVHYWSVGMMPGRPNSLYEPCPSLRVACSLLGCPAVLSGDDSIVHVASLNPVSALVASAWIRHEITHSGQQEPPFVFPFIVDLATWESLQQRHFSA
jgi:hypothetical protein